MDSKMECQRHKQLPENLQCHICWFDREVYPKIRYLLLEIADLESTRDKIGRHTNVSAHFENLMNTHEEVFRQFDVVKQPPKNAS